MNTNWLQLSAERRIEILNQASNITGLPAIAIEKDWWVTLALKASFSLEYSPNIVFKGGTSLSKGWNLIERFSEDIDFAIDRKFFGFEGEISKTQIKNLRKKSCEFISTTFLADLVNQFTVWQAIDVCKIYAHPVNDSDKDPQVIEIDYNSAFDKSDYLPQRVLIEVSSRSLMEPCENREINSILSSVFPDQNFASKPFKCFDSFTPTDFFRENIFITRRVFTGNR
ncbi:MAG: nucleotidyl transferase AbiEii/AbiGii toxin family protein [Paludibacter sp.]|nr:nucleotidyl transferase AbiEii/AbiGii toxin family protein [Paludibacter sp.]